MPRRTRLLLLPLLLVALVGGAVACGGSGSEDLTTPAPGGTLAPGPTTPPLTGTLPPLTLVPPAGAGTTSTKAPKPTTKPLPKVTTTKAPAPKPFPKVPTTVDPAGKHLCDYVSSLSLGSLVKENWAVGFTALHDAVNQALAIAPVEIKQSLSDVQAVLDAVQPAVDAGTISSTPELNAWLLTQSPEVQQRLGAATAQLNAYSKAHCN